MKHMSKLGSRPKIGYLTIDDAPSKDSKNKVKYLQCKGTNAIFFCQGRFLEERLEEAV